MFFRRKRDVIAFFPWVIEVLFATAILLLEGWLHLVWWLIPVYRMQEFISATFLRKPREEELALDYDFVDLVHYHGYRAEEHYVSTKDGHVLGIHRIRAVDEQTSGSGSPPQARPPFKGVVFFQHGFMQNSESWVARGPGKCLAYTLVDEGYDVWLGNNRGNKYSFKHEKYSPDDVQFWDFCIDDFAMYDIPAMVEYILAITQSQSLSYVGFSQGSAQAFAAFSVNQQLASKINLFVALAPAARVNSLKNPLVAAVTVSKPKLIFLLFGRKALLGQTLFWRRVLSRQLYTVIIDYCLDILFGWKCLNLDPSEKTLLYSHLYSYCSVKTLVHWFQITANCNFQAFDDNIKNGNPSYYRSYILPSYAPSRISCPMAVFYGGKDSIPSMDWLLKQLPAGTFVHREESYEHLDFTWAHSAPELIDTKVVQLIRAHNKSKQRKSESEGMIASVPTFAH